MAPGTLFGLVLMGAGIFLFAVSRVLTDRVAKFRVEWFQPNLDKRANSRRNVRILRIMAGVWVVIGIGCASFGVITGR